MLDLKNFHSDTGKICQIDSESPFVCNISPPRFSRMKKLLLSISLASLFAPALLKADVGEIDNATTFSGTITAVEQTRNSITVENSAGKVKMFSVTPEQKQDLQKGQHVVVNFTDAYKWPLQTSSISKN
jgi:hypothetical protein